MTTKTKTYRITENGVVTLATGTSKDAVAAAHFGVERAVHCMVPRGAFGSWRSSVRRPAPRIATVEIVKAEGRP